MFKELLSLFRSSDSIARMAADFSEMLRVAREITVAAGKIFFEEDTETGDIVEISKRDVAINKLERGIRKQVIASGRPLRTGMVHYIPKLILRSLMMNRQRNSC